MLHKVETHPMANSFKIYVEDLILRNFSTPSSILKVHQIKTAKMRSYAT